METASAPAAPDAELHALLDAGELRQAGTWLVQRHTREVLGLCGAMVRDPTTAEDLTQDVFGRAFSGLHAYRREASSRTWLLAIARNRCIDHLRALRRDPWLGAPPDDESADPDHLPDAAPLPAELLTSRAQVQAALDELSEGERALVVLRYCHGLDYRELAHVFGIRQGTARMRLSRALLRMRRALEQPRRELAAYSLACDEPAFDSEAAPAPAPPPSAAPSGSPPPASRAAAAPRRARRAASGRGLLGRLFGSDRGQEGGAAATATDLFAATLAEGLEVSRRLERRLFELAGRIPAID